VRDLIETAIASVLADPTLVDYVVGQRPQAERDSFKTALTKRPGKVRLGYGLETEEDWQVTVMMQGTRSTPRTVGDIVGDTEEDVISTALLTDDITEAAGVTLSLDSIPAELPAKGRLRIDNELAIYAYDGQDVTLPYRGLVGTTAAAHSIDDTVEFHTVSEFIGWQEDVTVRVDVLSSNTYLNAVLGALVKATLIASQESFEIAGMTLADVQESELTPRPASWPSTLFNYQLQVTVRRWVAVPSELGVITDFDVTLTPEGTSTHESEYASFVG